MADYINRDEIKWYGCDFEGGTTCVRHNGPCSTCTHGTVSHDEVMEMESVKIPTWNPVSTRPLTEEEKELYGDEYTLMWDCAVPEEEQTVLITTRFGTVTGTEFIDGYFENYEDIGDVLAWMPLPAPYEGGTKC